MVTKRIYQKHKTEYKVTISYELNKKVNPSYFGRDKDTLTNPRYPIYIRIRVRGKNTLVRSRITNYVLEGNLEKFLKEKIDYVNQEKRVINKIISTFEPNNNEDFDLKEFTKIYNLGALPACLYLSNLFMQETLDVLKERLSIKSYAFFGLLKNTPVYSDTFMLFASLLKELNVEYLKEYIDNRQDIIDYYLSKSLDDRELFNERKFYNALHSHFSFNFCLLDVDSGFFQDIIKRDVWEFDKESMKVLDNLKNKHYNWGI